MNLNDKMDEISEHLSPNAYRYFTLTRMVMHHPTLQKAPDGDRDMLFRMILNMSVEEMKNVKDEIQLALKNWNEVAASVVRILK